MTYSREAYYKDLHPTMYARSAQIDIDGGCLVPLAQTDLAVGYAVCDEEYGYLAMLETIVTPRLLDPQADLRGALVSSGTEVMNRYQQGQLIARDPDTVDLAAEVQNAIRVIPI